MKIVPRLLMNTRSAIVVLSLGTLAGVAAAPRLASAQSPAAGLPVQIVAMYGTQAAHPYIDPQLAAFTDRLTKPPLSSYNSYAKVEDIRIAAPFGQTTERALPGGETLDLVVRPKSDSPGRFTLHAEIKQPGAGAPKVVDLTLPEKKAFFIGGQHYKEGNMVLAFTLNP